MMAPDTNMSPQDTNNSSGWPGVPSAQPSPSPATAPRRPSTALVCLVALVGGLVAVPVAIVQEFRAGAVGWVGAVIVAPIVEEALKPIGVLFLLEKRFHWLRGGGQIVLMAAGGALVFATIENIMYINVSKVASGTAYVMWRYLICTGMHLTASTIFGLGLAKVWRKMTLDGKGFRIKGLVAYYVAAAVLHGLYNATVYILSVTKVLTFE